MMEKGSRRITRPVFKSEDKDVRNPYARRCGNVRPESVPISSYESSEDFPRVGEEFV